MRRNMPGNRGPGSGGRNIANHRPFVSGGGGGVLPTGGGPLLTNHLEIHDLDLELALLKRKREMIEEQHSLLMNQPPLDLNRFSYNEPHNFNQPMNQSRNIPRSQQFSSFDNQRAAKRPSVWENDSHFDGPSRPKAPNLGRFSNPRPTNSGSSGPRRPPRDRPNFTANKVNKPRQNSAPNRINSHPVDVRKSLVTAASNASGARPANRDGREKLIHYRTRESADNVLLGRLGLALGNILKEMREEFGSVEPYSKIFSHVRALRILKSAIRQRIDDIMLGKMVGSSAEIVSLYRKRHPKHKDIGLIRSSEDACRDNKQAIRLVYEENPEKHFKINFNRLLDVTLTKIFDLVLEMFQKVEDINTPFRTVVDQMLGEIQRELEDKNLLATLDAVTGSQSSVTAEEDQANEVKEGDQSEKDVSVEGQTEEQPEKVTEGEEAAPEAKPEEKQAETAVNEEKSTENATTDNKEVVEKQDNENKDATEEQTKTDDTVAENNPADESVGDHEKTKIESNVALECLKGRFFNKIMINMLKRSLPVLLPKYKKQLKTIMDADEAFRNTSDYVYKTTQDLMAKNANGQGAAEKATNSNTDETEERKKPRRDFFVKIIGRNHLPPKNLMKEFLDEFHPTLIKKHRHRHNNLFVSFGDKQDYDNILAKTGTKIGNMTLEITPSEKPTKNNRPKVDNSAANEENKSLLDESLDSQINDLLTSIREEVETEEMKENELLEGPTDGNITEEKANDGEETANGNQDPMETAEIAESTEAKQDNEAINKEGTGNGDTVEEVPTEPVNKDVAAVKEVAANGTGKATPTRASTRLASTPATVRTRRASKLGQ